MSKSSPLKIARQEAYKHVILEAAELVFANHGYDAAKVTDIADTAGVSVGTIYGVFGSKAELFGAVLTHRLPELLEIAHRSAVDATTPIERLTSGLDATILYMLEHPDFLRIHLRDHAWGLGPVRADRQQVAAWREGMVLEAQILEVAMDLGLVIREDPYRLARMIAAIQQVHLNDWVEDGMLEPPAVVVRRLHDLVARMFFVDRVPG